MCNLSLKVGIYMPPNVNRTNKTTNIKQQTTTIYELYI